MRLHAQIGEYDMTDIILDLGSEVNVLTKQTWEQMGKPTLDWSPIQLRLANQQKIVPLGRFPSVSVDIDGVSTLAYFEVIEIIDDRNPYPALLGIEWEIDNDAVINLKKRQMTFEGKGLRVIVPLDPSQGDVNFSYALLRHQYIISFFIIKAYKAGSLKETVSQEQHIFILGKP